MDNTTTETILISATHFQTLQIDKMVIFMITFSISVSALVANGIVLYLTWKYKQFHTPFMLVRAAYTTMDFITSCIGVPFSILRYLSYRDMLEITCYLTNIGAGVFFASAQLTAFIAIERYYYFCKPMKYPRYFTPKSIIFFTIAFCMVGEAYMFVTDLIIGRVTYEFFSLCHLPAQTWNNIFQLTIFVAPAITCTLFSVYNIRRA